MIDAIRAAWGWTGIEPLEVVGDNDFGNLIVKDVKGRYWRLCPEDCYCRVIAQDRAELDRLSADQAFLRDWHMSALVDQAYAKLGVLPEGRRYCLKIPGVLGGEYGGDNLASAPLEDIIRMSGELARQIGDLPDGASIQLNLAD
jgi:hypothetical protein